MQVLLTAPLTSSRKLINAYVQLGKTVSFSAFCMVKQNSLFANQILKVNLLCWTGGHCHQGRRTDLAAACGEMPHPGRGWTHQLQSFI